MKRASLTILLLAGFLGLLPQPTVAQDATPDETTSNTTAPDAAAPSMQDILSSLEEEPAQAPVADPVTDPTSEDQTIEDPAIDAPAAPPNSAIRPSAVTPSGDLSRITPDPATIPTGTMVKPAVTDSEQTEIVPAQPLENMNPALLPQPAADEAPKAVRAETKPAAPRPPEYEARPYVTLQTLDKVTARTATLTVKVGDTVEIGPLYVQVKTCQQAAPLETPDSAAFLQIWEAKRKDQSLKNAKPAASAGGPSQWVFSGWMFASSPALSAMDHPIYDIWVLDCKNSATDTGEKSAATKAAKTGQESATSEAAPTADPAADAEATPDANSDTEAAPDESPSNNALPSSNE